LDKDTDRSNAGDDPDAAVPSRPARAFTLRRLWPVLVLVAGLVAFFAFGLDEYVTVEALRLHRAYLLDFVDRHTVLAGLIFVGVYATAVAISVPGGTPMTLAGGFLFGAALASVYVVFAATVGATVLFVVVKHALGDPLRVRVRPWLGKMEDGFNRNAFGYLLSLRLFAVFPFWAVNLVPAFLGVRLRTYVVATFVGIIPATCVFASFGNGLGTVLDAGGTPDLGLLGRPEILLPLLGLAVLALLPAAFRRYKGRARATPRGD
jgi:uncharacterized membrane protein YdjX (TVP38/TMEM64 family)